MLCLSDCFLGLFWIFHWPVALETILRFSSNKWIIFHMNAFVMKYLTNRQTLALIIKRFLRTVLRVVEKVTLRNTRQVLWQCGYHIWRWLLPPSGSILVRVKLSLFFTVSDLCFCLTRAYKSFWLLSWDISCTKRALGNHHRSYFDCKECYTGGLI